MQGYNSPRTKRFAALALLFALFAATGLCRAQSVNPVFVLLDDETAAQQTTYTGSAPVRVRFQAQAEGFEKPADLYFEWKFYKEGGNDPYDVKRDSVFEYTFTESGSHRITCLVTYNGLEYEGSPLSITVQESKLEFPNAFSPNGDGINDVYRAKPSSQSIVEFKAAIFNRWGQMVFRFRDINDAWDGTYNGKPVKDGVYFLNCEAKGADGQTYRIRRDVNILRGFTEKEQ